MALGRVGVPLEVNNENVGKGVEGELARGGAVGLAALALEGLVEALRTTETSEGSLDGVLKQLNGLLECWGGR